LGTRPRPSARVNLILLSEGRAQDALAELDHEPSAGYQAIGRVMAFDALGRHAEADKLLASVEKDVASWQWHDRERALLWLERARRAHDPGYINYLKCDPMLAELRADPRYQTMLAQLNLPP
jgi:hypothetical protein